jgi:dTDP-4-dehydrorhamnose reductase
MRIFLTGASGFVGSNFAHVFGERHGAEVIAPGHEHVDLTDAALVRRTVAATHPDAVVHAAIWNDPVALLSDRRRAWETYVGATRNLVDAANEIDAQIVLISTDWVFDGTRAPATESEPPRPINAYGFLKACSELVITERARRGTVARIAAVQGVHRARPTLPRSQDAGFGYLVASLVSSVTRGERFTVWDGADLNCLATPTLASDAAELVWRALEQEATGTLHCCGGEHASRVELAQRAVAVFALNPDMLETGPPPPASVPMEGVPYDTRLDARATAERLGVELPGLDEALARLRAEMFDTAGSRA